MVTGRSLALAYLEKAQKRLRVLEVLLEEQAYSDVVREAQEVVELALKAMLRLVGVEPPKQHDVGGFACRSQLSLCRGCAAGVASSCCHLEVAAKRTRIRLLRRRRFYPDGGVLTGRCPKGR
jgi:hypothetical protein